MYPEQRWLTVKEVSERLAIPYRLALALVQDGELTYRLRNPRAARRIYLVSADSVERYEKNHTQVARGERAIGRRTQ